MEDAIIKGKVLVRYVGSATKYVVPDGIEEIADGCFFNCMTLNEITIPDTVKSIGDYAFMNCAELRNLYLPNSVESMGHNVIWGCKRIESFRLARTVHVDMMRWNECVDYFLRVKPVFTDVDGTAHNLVAYAHECKRGKAESAGGVICVRKFILPNDNYLGAEDDFDALRSSYDHSWLHCNLLNFDIEEFVVEEGNRFFCAVDGVLYIKAHRDAASDDAPDCAELFRCPRLYSEQSLMVAPGTKHIRSMAFYGCKLEHLHLPESLISAHLTAFYGLGNIRELVLPCQFRGFQYYHFDPVGNDNFAECRNLRRVIWFGPHAKLIFVYNRRVDLYVEDSVFQMILSKIKWHKYKAFGDDAYSFPGRLRTIESLRRNVVCVCKGKLVNRPCFPLDDHVSSPFFYSTASKYDEQHSENDDLPMDDMLEKLKMKYKR